MNAKEAAALAERQLKNEVIAPFIEVINNEIKKQAEKGLFVAKFSLPIKHYHRTNAVWNSDVAKSVKKKLQERGFKVTVKTERKTVQGYGDDPVGITEEHLEVSWKPNDGTRNSSVCGWCHGSGKDTSADGKREVECGSCGGRGRT